ncbi:hypothetical protein RJ639_006712 [Escallonia herrerae]|uniref:Pentatricopeptide repeat-containing protein n=1 Tax=Escallonia herrerae TaxID=1293975 RepID=A0AA88VYW0_9ASTE|nr:hypothetical protein RJ639_006712 [Escallonia herrerae]
MENMSEISWNVMMAGLVKNGRGLDALELFHGMRLAGVKLTQRLFLILTDRAAVSLVATGDHAAKIFTPGAVMSGCAEQFSDSEQTKFKNLLFSAHICLKLFCCFLTDYSAGDYKLHANDYYLDEFRFPKIYIGSQFAVHIAKNQIQPLPVSTRPTTTSAFELIGRRYYLPLKYVKYGIKADLEIVELDLV